MEVFLPKKLVAEGFGTFCLVFAGTGAIIINDISGGAVTHVGVALTFGLIVFAMIASMGDVSGAHLNPAVTFGFFIAGRFPGQTVIPYIISQCCGAILVSVTLFALFPTHRTLGSTIPAGSAFQSLVLEILLTSILMFVILSVTAAGKEKGITVGMTIGGVIALAALFAGPVSGASMNPARSLAPALLSWQLDYIWIYLTGPFLGAVFGVPLCRYSRKSGCCRLPFVEEKC
ncbi:MAG TPA: aquaporin [Candidatus Limnocylindrales bacterium]|nr:aquaporin [Candidatus Limnocylindrales bacterium]